MFVSSYLYDRPWKMWNVPCLQQRYPSSLLHFQPSWPALILSSRFLPVAAWRSEVLEIRKMLGTKDDRRPRFDRAQNSHALKPACIFIDQRALVHRTPHTPRDVYREEGE